MISQHYEVGPRCLRADIVARKRIADKRPHDANYQPRLGYISNRLGNTSSGFVIIVSDETTRSVPTSFHSVVLEVFLKMVE